MAFPDQKSRSWCGSASDVNGSDLSALRVHPQARTLTVLSFISVHDVYRQLSRGVELRGARFLLVGVSDCGISFSPVFWPGLAVPHDGRNSGVDPREDEERLDKRGKKMVGNGDREEGRRRSRAHSRLFPFQSVWLWHRRHRVLPKLCPLADSVFFFTMRCGFHSYMNH